MDIDFSVRLIMLAVAGGIFLGFYLKYQIDAKFRKRTEHNE